MKNILKYILCFAVCVGAFFATATTAYAESDEPIMCGEAFNVGDRIYYYGRINSYDDMYLLYDKPATQSTYRVCIYLVDGNSSSGKVFQVLNNMIVGDVYKTKDNSLLHTGFGLQGYTPQEYMFIGSGTTIDFKTNIPIFENKADADVYYNTGEGLNKAINYKKVFENGSWVKPFEDIEINDSEIIVPELINISHTEFTVSNYNTDKYVVDVYMLSGIEKPENYMNKSLDVENALFVNNFGYVSNNTETYHDGKTFDIALLYGVDNYTALLDSVSSFYTTYPSANSYYSGYKASDNFQIWGQPFGKIGAFFMNSTKVTSDELAVITPYKVPLCFTQYRVRFAYYDADSGMHLGPWGVYTYFSDGSVTKSAIFQSNTGDIIETPSSNGVQDSTGNVSFDTSDIVDFDNPNQLFSYLRSFINNVNATGNTFMTLFATFFGFIPIEIQLALWLGIACMIFIGVIKSV